MLCHQSVPEVAAIQFASKWRHQRHVFSQNKQELCVFMLALVSIASAGSMKLARAKLNMAPGEEARLDILAKNMLLASLF